jgi:hypothetical protein
MCGTFTQIAGMAFGLYFTDQIISPVMLGRSEFSDVIMFLIKGAVQFGIYRWFQCTSTGSYNKNAFKNMSFMEIILGGLVGGVTLFFAGQIVNEYRARDAMSIFWRYGLEAVILNFVFGATKSMITGAMPPSGSVSGS